MDEATIQARWEAWIAWNNALFNGYLEVQESLGVSREEALARLGEIWKREDAERLEAHRRAGKIYARAR